MLCVHGEERKHWGLNRAFLNRKRAFGFGSSRNIMGKQVRVVNSKWSITNIPLKYKKRKEKKGTVINKPNEPMRDKKIMLPRWRHNQRKPSVQSRLVGLREWSLKWVERRLAKRDIADCRSWIWRAAFGLSKRWALHNPIFLTKHWDTKSLERQRWKQCVHMCVFPLRRCWSLALVMPWGKFRTYCGWIMHKAEYVRRTKEQSGRETMSQ